MPKNQHAQRKPLYFENKGSTSLSKIGHDFTNKVIQKLTVEKNVFNKKWSPKLILLNEIFDFESMYDFGTF